MRKLIEYLKKSEKISSFIAYIYNLLFNKGRCVFSSNIRNNGGYLRNVKFHVNKNSVVEIGPYTIMRNCSLSISGENSKIIIKGKGTYISNFSLCCEDDCSCIIIDEHTTMLGGEIASIEGCKVVIGKDCMFSANIDIRNGDSHSILSKLTGERINKSQDVIIGNHVWLTRNVSVLKGSTIANNSIIGHSSVVSGDCCVENSVYAGIPARRIKGEIDWDKIRL